MIDHLLRYNEMFDAIMDPFLDPYKVLSGSGEFLGWRLDQVVVGQQCWQTSMDTTITDPVTGATDVLHTYLPYSYVTVMKPSVDLMLQNLPNCMLVADRDKAQAGSTSFIVFVQPALTVNLNDYHVAPMPLGSDYPFGNL